MKVEFDDWSSCYFGSSFTLDLDCIPRIGEEVWIQKELMHPRFSEGAYLDNPPEEIDGFIKTTVSIVEHRISMGGHLVRIDIDL